jgi:hypothetical protein
MCHSCRRSIEKIASHNEHRLGPIRSLAQNGESGLLSSRSQTHVLTFICSATPHIVG